MESITNIVLSVLLVTMCISGVLAIAVFWYFVLTRLFDSIVGIKPTDKEVDEMTK